MTEGRRQWAGLSVLSSVVCLLSSLLPAPAAADVVAACKAQSGCRLAATVPAGEGPDGKAITVYELNFKSPPAESWAAGLECRDGYREFWVAAGGEESLLLELCNDGYGSSGVGEDAIEIEANRLTHGQYGGSAWRWSGIVSYQLSPLRILSEGWEGYWTLGANYEEGQWDWTDYSQGEVEWWAPFCDQDGYVPDNEGTLPDDAQIQHFLAIPRLQEASVPPGMERAHLGTCALTLSTETGRGYIVHGDAEAAAADQAWMRLLAYGPDRLAVTVRLPSVLSGGKSWLADDHIEIWQSPLLSYGSGCIDQKSPSHQWAVRLSDGAVFAAHGDPAALPAVIGRETTLDSGGGAVVTLHLALAEPLENLTAVLSRGDGKKKQRWLLASSDLAFAKPWTFGQTYTIPAEAASCAISDHRLEVTEWSRPVPGP